MRRTSLDSGTEQYEMSITPDPRVYMNALILQLARSEIPKMTIPKSEPLPILAELSGEQLDVDFARLVNCLKVTSQLNPVSYREPVTGKFPVTCLDADGRPIQITVHSYFEDREPEPYVEVRVERQSA